MEKEMEDALIGKIEAKVKESQENFKKGLIDDTKLKEILEPLQKELESMKKDYNPESLKTGIDELSKQIALLRTASKASPETLVDELKQSIKEASEQLKERGKGFINLKVAAQMTTANISGGYIPLQDREPGVTSVVRQQFTLRNGATVFGTSANYVEWVEQRNRDGAAAATAEGNQKPLIDWDYVIDGTKVEKITARVKISREMLSDIDGILGYIQSELAYAVELAEETYFYSGTGNTPQINGIGIYMQALDLAALAGTVPAPNNWDAIAAAITQIRVNGKGEFKPNRIFMNPVDIFLSVHAIKETSENYINPVTVQVSPVAGGMPTVFVWNVPVVDSDSVPAGNFLVADMTKFTIRDREGFTVEMGYDDDDFSKNMVTLIGEKRLATYVKANHVEAFVGDSFADAKLFLTPGS